MLNLGDTEKKHTHKQTKPSMVNIIDYWCQYKLHEFFLFRKDAVKDTMDEIITIRCIVTVLLLCSGKP